MKNALAICLFGFTLYTAGNAMANFSYEGHLTNLSDYPLSNQAATVRISVLGPVFPCVVFMETHAVSTDAKGFFSVQVGAGTDVDGLPTNSLDSVFSNHSTLSGMAACFYTPVATDARRLKIEVDTTGIFETLGFIALGKAPQAVHADAVGGYSATNFVRSASAAPLLTSSDVTVLSQLIAGTSPLYAGPGASVTGVNATLPITSSGGATPNLTISQANASTAGYLTSADWTTFNNKLGITTAVTGDLLGTYAATTVAKIRGKSVSAAVPINGDVLRFDGSQYVPSALTAPPVTTVAGRIGAVTLGSADISGLGSAALKNVGTFAGTVAAGDDSRLVNGLTTALPMDQAFIGNLLNIATARNILLTDIRSSVTPVIPAFNIGVGCSLGEMISYFSSSGQFTCQPFSLTNGQVLSALAAGGPLSLPSGSPSSPTYSFSGDSTTGIFSPGFNQIGFVFAGLEAMRITNTGNIGIRTTSPDSALSVGGTMRATSISGSHLDNATTDFFNFANANMMTSTFNCASVINISNMRDGGIYKIVNRNTGTAQCSFSSNLTGADAATVTYKFSPLNSTRNASSDSTLYELNRMGNIVYVKWMSMF